MAAKTPKRVMGYMRLAATDCADALRGCRMVIDEIADLATHRALGQALLRLQEAQHELAAAIDCAKKAKLP